MAQITYSNKVALNVNPSIDDINKVTDDDMNEIKEVVNTNDTAFQNATAVSTTEKVIGTFNGKPLYSKTYTFTVNHATSTNTVEVNTPHNLANIDTIYVDLGNSFAVSGGVSYVFGRTYINNNAVAITMSAIVDSTNIRSEIYYRGSITFDFTVTLNYTKTTD